MKFKNYVSVSSKRIVALALTSALAFGSVYNGVAVSAMQGQAIVQQQANQEAGNVNNIWDGNIDTSWYIGHEADAEFTISNPAQLAGLAELVNNSRKSFKDKTIKLSNHLNMGNHLWTSIGNENKLFDGTFDGNGKTISNLTTDETKDRQGLFGNNQGIIKKIGIINSEIKGKKYVGGVVGCNKEGTIENSYNEGNVKGESHVGGVVGYSYEGTMKNSCNTGNVEGNIEGDFKYVGGVIGYNYHGTMENSYNKGAVKGKQHVGGVAGYVDEVTTKKIYNMGNVKGEHDVGGVAGYNKGTIENSYNTGDIIGKEGCAGGVVGSNKGTIEDSYNKGNVKSEEGCVGGVVGFSYCGIIKNSYNAGAIRGRTSVGGIVGSDYGEGTIKNSYNSGAIRGQTYVGGIVGSDYFGVIENSYYCKDKGKITIEKGDPIEVGEGIRSGDMKTQEFAKKLGKSFNHVDNINDNFPILISHENDLLIEYIKEKQTSLKLEFKTIQKMKKMKKMKKIYRDLKDLPK